MMPLGRSLLGYSVLSQGTGQKALTIAALVTVILERRDGEQVSEVHACIAQSQCHGLAVMRSTESRSIKAFAGMNIL
jgi:hypothetical protein